MVRAIARQDFRAAGMRARDRAPRSQGAGRSFRERQRRARVCEGRRHQEDGAAVTLETGFVYQFTYAHRRLLLTFVPVLGDTIVVHAEDDDVAAELGGRQLGRQATAEGAAAMLVYENGGGEVLGIYLRPRTHRMREGERRDGGLMARYWSQGDTAIAVVSSRFDQRADAIAPLVRRGG